MESELSLFIYFDLYFDIAINDIPSSPASLCIGASCFWLSLLPALASDVTTGHAPDLL